jgi:hypothetical protein
MEAHQFDDLTRFFARSGTRRGLVRSAVGALAAAFVSSIATACGNPLSRASGLTCDGCKEIAGTVISGACEGILSGAVTCPEWRCRVASVGICLIAEMTGMNDMVGMDDEAICASSKLEKIVRLMGGESAPCAGRCGDDEEVCPVTGGCVPRCGGDRWLDPVTCRCVDEPEAITGSGDKKSPRRPSDATGAGALRRWRLVVPEDQVMIVGAQWATLNGVPYGDDWVLVAYPGNTPVDMTIGHGFWTVVEEPLARSFFCGQFRSPTQPLPMNYERVIGLDTWGVDACWAGSDPVVPFATAGNQYESPFYGYRLSWSDAWAVTMEHSWWVGGPEGGFDQIQLAKGSSIVAVTGTRQWGGDGATCLDGVARGIADWPGDSAVFRTGAVDDRPLGVFGGYEDAAAYQYTFTWPNGSAEQRIAYVDCVTIPGDAANMVFLFDAPLDRYGQQLSDREEILQTLRLSSDSA